MSAQDTLLDTICKKNTICSMKAKRIPKEAYYLLGGVTAIAIVFNTIKYLISLV